MRWKILRSASFYPIRTQIRIIMTCFLLHNFIRGEMVDYPMEQRLDANEMDNSDNVEHTDYIAMVEATPEWTSHREELAQQMWAEFINIS